MENSKKNLSKYLKKIKSYLKEIIHLKEKGIWKISPLQGGNQFSIVVISYNFHPKKLQTPG